MTNDAEITFDKATPNPNQVASRGGRARYELLLTMLGAVCGTVITAALDVLEVSDTEKVIGLAVGAALPPFVAAIGRFHGVRVTIAVILTSVALVISYGGFAVFAFAAQEQPVVPLPNRIKAAMGSGGGEGSLRIAVYPSRISCDARGCTDVEVISASTAQLRVTSLEFSGDGRAGFTADGCTGARLSQGESCTITVDHTGSSTKSATLVIHQNLPGPPTYVPISVASPPVVNCGLGEHRDGDRCVPDECPGDQVLLDGECADPTDCPGGEPGNADGDCVPTTCPDGQVLKADECVPEPDCPDGEPRNADGSCEPPTCPVGLLLDGDACVPDENCPAGQERNGDECVPISCPAGEERTADGCEVVPPTCDAGEVRNDPGACVEDETVRYRPRRERQPTPPAPLAGTRNEAGLTLAAGP